VLPNGKILPVPPDYAAGSTSKWLFTIWAGGLALVVLPWIVWRLVKREDPVPLLVWIGGFICALGEPMLDTIGHLWWPKNLPGPAFKLYGLSVPALIPPCYTATVALAGYIFYRLLARGTTVRGVFLMWTVGLGIDLALELPGTSSHVYTYYGSQPFSVAHFPLHWPVLNSTGYLAVGFGLWLVVPRVQGWWRLLIALVPVTAFLGSYGMTGWPAFIALNGRMSHTMQDIVDLGTLVLCLLIVRGMAELVTRPLGLAPLDSAPQPLHAEPPRRPSTVTASVEHV
jgi:hypothetical protein